MLTPPKTDGGDGMPDLKNDIDEIDIFIPDHFSIKVKDTRNQWALLKTNK